MNAQMEGNMSKTYSIKQISNLLCYSIEDICNLYVNRKLHPQTVRKWIKNGLPVIDNHKPVLVHGSDLKYFLGKINDKHHFELNFDKFYCFSCKEPHVPYNRTIYIEHKQKCILAKAICSKNKKVMNKSFKLSDLSALQKNFTIEPLSRLYDSLNSTLKTKIDCNNKNQKNESGIKQGEFNYE